jgi:hypothetical protein
MSHRIIVHAGPHPRSQCPVSIPWPHDSAPSELLFGSDSVPVQKLGDRLYFVIPSAREDRVVWADLREEGAPPLSEEERMERWLELGGSAEPGEEPEEAGQSGVEISDHGRAIAIQLNGADLTTYHYKNVPARPYFWPVLASGGVQVTRSWPMENDNTGETKDHPHHRSMYFAFGSVNGVDNWSEEEGHGRTLHRSVDELICGPVLGRFSTTSDWVDSNNNRLLEQKLTATFWHTKTVLVFPERPSKEVIYSNFAAEKRASEAGLPFLDLSKVRPDPDACRLIPGRIARQYCVLPVKYDSATNTLWLAMGNVNDLYATDAVRTAARCTIRSAIASPLALDLAIGQIYGRETRIMDFDLRLTATDGDVLFGDTKEGGMLTVRVASSMDVERNQGGRIENSYGGVNEAETWGKAAHWCDYSGIVEGQKVGVAVMDHPESFRYPTYWHVRDYGLMAANPFALGDYTGGVKDGSHLLKSGETMRFRYRVVLHQGDALAADIRNQYLNFVAPPRVEVEEV